MRDALQTAIRLSLVVGCLGASGCTPHESPEASAVGKKADDSKTDDVVEPPAPTTPEPPSEVIQPPDPTPATPESPPIVEVVEPPSPPTIPEFPPLEPEGPREPRPWAHNRIFAPDDDDRDPPN